MNIKAFNQSTIMKLVELLIAVLTAIFRTYSDEEVNEGK